MSRRRTRVAKGIDCLEKTGVDWWLNKRQTPSRSRRREEKCVNGPVAVHPGNYREADAGKPDTAKFQCELARKIQSSVASARPKKCQFRSEYAIQKAGKYLLSISETGDKRCLVRVQEIPKDGTSPPQPVHPGCHLAKGSNASIYRAQPDKEKTFSPACEPLFCRIFVLRSFICQR